MKKSALIFALLIAGVAQAQVVVSGDLGNATVASNPTISCTPLTMAFGSQVDNTTSPAKTSVCSNPGNSLVTLTSVVISTVFFTFGPSNTCAAATTIAPGSNCTVAIQFTPTSSIPFTATATVTSTGATGSPQTIALSGTGVPSSGGGPTSYSATTVRTVISHSLNPNTPPTENTPFLDNDFQHSTAGPAPCNNSGTCEDVCAGPVMAGIINGLDSTFSATASFNSPPATEANSWSIDDLEFTVGTSSGGRAVAFNVNPTTLTCTFREEFGGQSVITPGVGSLSFSKTVAKHINAYGQIVGNTTPTLYDYDDTAACVHPQVINCGTATLLANFATQGVFPAGQEPGGTPLVLTSVAVSGGTTTYNGTITGGASNGQAGKTFLIGGFTNSGNNISLTVVSSTATTFTVATTTQVNETHPGTATAGVIGLAGGWDSSFDVTAGGADSAYCTAMGKVGEAQNNWSYTVCYWRPTGGIQWWDVKLDKMGGNGLWPGTSCEITSCGGLPTGIFCVSCTGLSTGAGLHSVTVTPDGTGSVVAFNQPTLWLIGSSTATLISPTCQGNGHRANVANMVICMSSGAGGAGQEIAQLNSSFNTVLFKAARVGNIAGSPPLSPTGATDQHNSGVAVSVTGVGLMYTHAFNIAGNGGCQPTNPGNNEIMMMSFDGSGTTWRFSYDYNNACLNGGSNSQSYYSGSVSPDGTLVDFQTNWNGGFGTDNQGNARRGIVLTQLY